MLEIGSDHGSGAFWPQSNTAAAPVGEGVHFLLDDIRRLPNSPLEELSVFEHGCPQLLIAIGAADSADLPFQLQPILQILAENICRTSGTCGDRHYRFSLL